MPNNCAFNGLFCNAAKSKDELTSYNYASSYCKPYVIWHRNSGPECDLEAQLKSYVAACCATGITGYR